MNICDKIRFLIVRVRAKIHGFPIIKVDDDVIRKFRNEVKGNKNKSDLEIIKKINRDYYSGQIISDNKNMTIVAYGYLRIFYTVEINKIDLVQNYKADIVYKGYINQELKSKLNKLYGIKESK